MDGKPKRKKGKFQFSLRSLMVFTLGACIVLAICVRQRDQYVRDIEQAKRDAEFRQTFGHFTAVLRNTQAHIAFRQHPLLSQCFYEYPALLSRFSREESLISQYDLYGGSSRFSSHSTDQGSITIQHDFNMLTSEMRPSWPVQEISEAILTTFVEAAKDAGLLTSPKASFKLDNVVLSGKEGEITWDIKISKQRVATAKERVKHNLNIQISCEANFQFDDPITPLPKLYGFGHDVGSALTSGNVKDRLVGASSIYYLAIINPGAIFSAIEKETDAEVLSRLFRGLETVARPAVVAKLVYYMETKHSAAPLAARTILCSGVHSTLTARLKRRWNPTSLAYLRHASIDILENEEDRNLWRHAVEELRLHSSPNNKETINVFLRALERGGPRPGGLYEIYKALESNEYALDRLFTILVENDQPDVWFTAAQILLVNFRFKFKQGQTMRERIRNLEGVALRRMQLVAKWSPGFKDELAVLGDDALEYLTQFLGHTISENTPSPSRQASQMLAKLGDERAVPFLVQAVEDQHQHGELDDPASSKYGIHLVKAINELTGEKIGGLGIGLDATEAEAEAADWIAIRKTLAEKYGTPSPSESATPEANTCPVP